MDSKLNRSRSGKGSVQIKSSNGRLQLVFSYAGRRHYLSLGLSDNKVNRKAAEAKAKLIEADLAFDRFDPTLAKYKPQSLLSNVTPISTPKQPESLRWLELWQQYTDYKSSQVAASTLVRDYGKIKKRIQVMPNLYDAVGIRDWLLKEYSAETARRTLVQLNACGNWAVRSEILEQNPFKGMPSDITKAKQATNRKSFSANERDVIIQAFDHNTYTSNYAPVAHSYYAPFVKFLFMTGARPEEAIALQWRHVATDCSKIYFKEALPSDTGIRGKTKTREQRIFPCNAKLQAFLVSIKLQSATSEDLVFRGPRGGVLDSHNFLNRTWTTVIEGLVKSGKVHEYLPVYNIRHTFITLALEHGLEAKDVAYLVGNSPEVVYRHYAGSKRKLVVPEF